MINVNSTPTTCGEAADRLERYSQEAGSIEVSERAGTRAELLRMFPTDMPLPEQVITAFRWDLM